MKKKRKENPSPTPAVISVYILKQQRSDDVYCGLLTPNRLDSAGLTPEKESHQLQVKLCPSKDYY